MVHACQRIPSVCVAQSLRGVSCRDGEGNADPERLKVLAAHLGAQIQEAELVPAVGFSPQVWAGSEDFRYTLVGRR